MIDIYLKERQIVLRGHAKRLPGAPPGHNIICAGVSALTLTLAEGLREIAGVPVEADLKPGNSRIAWSRDNEISKALVENWLLGVRGIQDSYGEITIVSEE